LFFQKKLDKGTKSHYFLSIEEEPSQGRVSKGEIRK